MKYISLDCETTGVDLRTSVITEIAFLVADTASENVIDSFS